MAGRPACTSRSDTLRIELMGTEAGAVMYQSCLAARAGAERSEVAWGKVEGARGEKSAGGTKGGAGAVGVGFEGAAAG